MMATLALENNSGDPGEDGYYLVFPDGLPPVDTDLTVDYTNLENGRAVTHASLGAQVVCFCAGTLIRTPEGSTPIENLSEGDLVETHDNGAQEIKWIGTRRINFDKPEAQDEKLRPIRITAGALGSNLPARDLWVSRQHRMLISSKVSERMFGETAVLVPAIKLIELPGIFIDQDIETVEYFHLLFDRHEVIFAEGAPSESLFTGPEASEGG